MMKKKLLQLLLLIIIIVTGLIITPRKDVTKETNPWVSDKTLVMAHAGGKGVYPDNTMKAFKYSYDLGVDVLEMDLQMTKDGVLVLRHGENNTGNIRSKSNCDTVLWEENYIDVYANCNFAYNFEVDGEYPYRDLSFQEWVNEEVYLTTLDDVFTEFGKDILYNIEIKADADAPRTETADALYDLIEEHDLFDYVLVATNYDDISSYMLENYPEMIISASYGNARSFIIRSYTFTSAFYQPEFYALQIPVSEGVPVLNELALDTRLLVSTAHRHNVGVHYWTINDEETMRHLIRINADGIITDYPELLLSILDEEN